MADEQISLILELLRELGAKTDRIAAGQTAMRAEQTSMRTDQAAMRADITRIDAKLERMDTKLDRAAARTDDVMAAQVRMKTDIAVIRALQEEDGHGLRQELDSLRERVDALERRD
jgi:hypothetical protein